MSISRPDNGGSRFTSPAPAPTGTLLTQTRWATLLLFLPLLVCVCALVFSGRITLATGLFLLPGAGTALYMTLMLWRNLETNRSTREPVVHFTTLGAANWLTLARSSAIVALACLLPAAQSQSETTLYGTSLSASLIYLAIGLADLADGQLARKTGRQTELGRILDMEADAAGLLVAALVAVALGRIPPFYIAAGIAYYIFITGMYWRRLRNLPLVELQPRPSGRIAAGFQMGFLAVVLLPFFSPLYSSIAALLFLVPLLLGFGRDWLVVTARLATDQSQQTRLDETAGIISGVFLSPLSRLVVLAAWTYLLINSWSDLPALAWLFSVGGCCLLVAGGILGRSASLLLVLLLGSVISPFAPSAEVMLIFCGAAVVLLSGTGSWSIWTPEEDLLYRRRNDPSESRTVPA